MVAVQNFHLSGNLVVITIGHRNYKYALSYEGSLYAQKTVPTV
jgi:hypothetical protein